MIFRVTAARIGASDRTMVLREFGASTALAAPTLRARTALKWGCGARTPGEFQVGLI